MVAIRSSGLAFESLLGFQEFGKRKSLVSRDMQGHLISIANERFQENANRTQRFRDALRDAVRKPSKGNKAREWEDAEARRDRKRAEGLKRGEDLRAEKSEIVVGQGADDDGLDGIQLLNR
jgi:tRNA wybutosine-synthesizing protein 3